MRRRAAFLDRDGVINVDRDYVWRQDEFEFLPGVFEAARELKAMDFALVVVTNQSGIGRGLYTEADFMQLTRWVEARFVAERAALTATYFCPHHPMAAHDKYRVVCDCRKPAPGMLLAAARDLGLDLGASVLFGDKITDLESARAASIAQRFLLGTDGRSLPPATAAPDLATARYRDLLTAVRSEAPRLSSVARAKA